jgi:hypothetical protein
MIIYISIIYPDNEPLIKVNFDLISGLINHRLKTSCHCSHAADFSLVGIDLLAKIGYKIPTTQPLYIFGVFESLGWSSWATMSENSHYMDMFSFIGAEIIYQSTSQLQFRSNLGYIYMGHYDNHYEWHDPENYFKCSIASIYDFVAENFRLQMGLKYSFISYNDETDRGLGMKQKTSTNASFIDYKLLGKYRTTSMFPLYLTTNIEGFWRRESQNKTNNYNNTRYDATITQRHFNCGPGVVYLPFPSVEFESNLIFGITNHNDSSIFHRNSILRNKNDLLINTSFKYHFQGNDFRLTAGLKAIFETSNNKPNNCYFFTLSYSNTTNTSRNRITRANAIHPIFYDFVSDNIKIIPRYDSFYKTNTQ